MNSSVFRIIPWLGAQFLVQTFEDEDEEEIDVDEIRALLDEEGEGVQ